ERQAELDARMRWCEYRIGRALVIDPATLQEKKVAFGATLTVLDLDADEELNYVIVGEHEAEVERGRISIHSPIARALLGKVVGDVVTLRLPKGDRELEVVKVRSEERRVGKECRSRGWWCAYASEQRGE